jgi:hypothetical protein
LPAVVAVALEQWAVAVAVVEVLVVIAQTCRAQLRVVVPALRARNF